MFWSGQVEDDGTGPVEPGAHFYRSYQLDGEGNPINKRNAWQARSVLYVRLIPPGAADVAHYRVRIPEDARGPITFTAKLNYRKFSHYYTQFAYAGQPEPGQTAWRWSAPASTIASFSFDPANIPANVVRADQGSDPRPADRHAGRGHGVDRGGPGRGDRLADRSWTRRDRERWNDWGIGLLLQGDLKGAEYAFKQVTEAEPEYADGWLNVARALIQEGETDAAKPFIAEALARNDAARPHPFLQGDDREGRRRLRRRARRRSQRAAEKYPRDRVVLNQMARILFLEAASTRRR